MKTLSLLLPALLATAIFSSCGTPEAPEPREVVTPPEAPPTDFSELRIGGRETIEVAPGITLHADQEKTQTDGTITFTGRIYLDGSGQKETGAGWPTHAYAERAVWNPSQKTVTLSDGVIAERGNNVWMGKSPETRLILDGEKIHTSGPMKMYGKVLSTHSPKPSHGAGHVVDPARPLPPS